MYIVFTCVYVYVIMFMWLCESVCICRLSLCGYESVCICRLSICESVCLCGYVRVYVYVYVIMFKFNVYTCCCSV